MLLPASTGSGELYLVRGRLAEWSGDLSSVVCSSDVSGSNTPEVVLAVLEMLVVREESTLTTRVTDLLAPLVRSEERRVGKEWRWGSSPVDETKIVPAGIGSDRLKPIASDGPLFVTVSV